MFDLLRQQAASGLFAPARTAPPPARPPVVSTPVTASPAAAAPGAAAVFDHYADGAERTALRELAAGARPDDLQVIRELAMELDWKHPEASHGAMHDLIAESRASGAGIDDGERAGLVGLLGDLHREARITTQRGEVLPDHEGRPGFMGRIDTAEEAGLSRLRRDLGTEHMGFVDSMAARGHDPERTRSLARDIDTFQWDGEILSSRDSADYVDMLAGRFDDHQARGGAAGGLELPFAPGAEEFLFMEAQTLAWPCQRPEPGRRPAAIPALLALHFDRETQEVSMPNLAFEAGGGLGIADRQGEPELATRPATRPRKPPGPVLRDPVTGAFDEAFREALDRREGQGG
jgi:hypothetical protein